MRLIDADALKNTLCGGIVCSECDDYFAGDNIKTNCSEIKLYFLKCIDFQEKIDAVPVTRCKDCKYKEGTNGEYNPEDIVCEYWMSDGLSEEDFCSKGEKDEAD